MFISNLDSTIYMYHTSLIDRHVQEQVGLETPHLRGAKGYKPGAASHSLVLHVFLLMSEI